MMLHFYPKGYLFNVLSLFKIAFNPHINKMQNQKNNTKNIPNKLIASHVYTEKQARTKPYLTNTNEPHFSMNVIQNMKPNFIPAS